MQKPEFGKAIDVHTHLYLPGYMDLLRSRKEVPRVIPPPPDSPIEAPERLLILPGEDADATTASGRPIGREYWSVEGKLAFMDAHGTCVFGVDPSLPPSLPLATHLILPLTSPSLPPSPSLLLTPQVSKPVCCLQLTPGWTSSLLPMPSPSPGP
jgi:hypothetical protein